MQDKYYNITLALAGMIQSVSLVRELAQTGKLNESAYEASIYSIFQTSPQDIPSIYGSIAGVKAGLEKIIHIFSPHARENARPLTRYTLSLIHLQKKIARNPELLDKLAQRVNQAKKQVEYFHLTHPNVIANLADTYLNTISMFKFRIIIWGSQRSLSVTENMDKIRALLLAGIRSAVLWRQMKGSRWQLLFSRGKIKAAAEKILADIERMEVK
ncbi:MAG: high frequency lysogenization protein HflD [Gammaproteobacteria bacterium]